MMSGTAKIKKVVPAIHAALPVLRRSFLDTMAALKGDAIGMDDDGQLGYVAASPGYEGMFAFLALGHSLFPLRRPTERTEKEIARSH